jgi:hypothetical protein
LKTENNTVFVKFPRHLAQSIKALGDSLSVSGFLRLNPQGVREIKMESISGKGQTVLDQKPVPVPAPLQGRIVNGKGKISDMQLNKRGDVCGYILDNGVVLRIPPHIAGQLSQTVRRDSEISYSGIEKTLKAGYVLAFDYTIIHCRNITVNGTQYIIMK